MRLEEALVNLDPKDMEKRRQADFGSEDFVQGSVDEFFKLPYGVRTPESIMSTGSRDFEEVFANAGGDFAGGIGGVDGWKLPDELRIVKPLEGSLTLHNWQQLALPSLGGIFEERRGIAFRGGLNHIDSTDTSGDLIEMKQAPRPEHLEEESTFGQEAKKYRKDEATLTRMTLTDSMVLHPSGGVGGPDNPQQNLVPAPAAETSVTSTSFSRTQMSCGFANPSIYQGDSGANSSLASSRLSSRWASNTSLNSLTSSQVASYQTGQ